jgi:hypothetical protein
MLVHGEGSSAWVLVGIIAALTTPWVAGIVWAWRHKPRDGAIPLSPAEHARQRLWRP